MSLPPQLCVPSRDRATRPEREKLRSWGHSAQGLVHWVLLLPSTRTALRGWAGGARGGA